MRRLFHWGRNRDEDDVFEPDITPEQKARNAVTNLRQRLHEDPDFKETFVDSLRKARDEEDAKQQAESQAHGQAYGDEDSDPVKASDQLHEIRGGAFFAVISLLEALSEPPREVIVGWGGQTEMTGNPDKILDELRRTIGEATLQAYSQAQLEPPVLIRQGAIGFHYEGFGTIVHLERYLDDQAGLNEPPEL